MDVIQITVICKKCGMPNVFSTEAGRDGSSPEPSLCGSCLTPLKKPPSQTLKIVFLVFFLTLAAGTYSYYDEDQARQLLTNVFQNDFPRPIENGKLLTHPRTKGTGVLKIANETAFDAVVKVGSPRSHELILSFYVKAKSDFTMKNLPAGKFCVAYTTGMEWDEHLCRFVRQAAYVRFKKDFEFASSPRAESQLVAGNNALSLTLKTGKIGKAEAESVLPGAFDLIQ